jgi:O-antigen ligase
MIPPLLIALFSIVFFFIAYRRFEWGVFLFFLLLPTYLIRFHIGPLPMTLLETMLLSLVTISILKNFSSLKTNTLTFLKQNKLFSIGIFFFLLGATFSVFTSIDIRAALGEWRAFYVEPILLFFVLKEFLKKEQATKYILFPLILCGLATSILSVYQHFTGWMVPFSFWQNRDTYRVTAWYGFPNAVGLFLAPLIPLALSLGVTTSKKHSEKFERIIFVFSLLFLITSPLALLFAKGSGPIIGTAAGIGMLFLYHKKLRLPALTLGVLSLCLLFFAPQMNSLKQELLAKDYSGSLRRDIWNETISLLKDHPLRGAGMASYDERIVPYRSNNKIEVFHHPHNIFLTIWVNTGIIGLIGFLLILLASFQTAFKTKTEETKFFLSSLVVILIMGFVDSPYIKNDLAILFWILPLFLHSYKNKKI